ncbi:peptidoglycan DD-metalloendopeptidase family protein [Endozoicomonas montiporae]|uniref:Peptidase M23B n=1 Tax=Endozoicomonas montiporae CL-33 TaxID=570277 RepID=A0A142B6Y9_9GAMM|nr:peptidoglycan DD-metalloendopeptidase family protein [Endozoicomonas montiporae]AMO54515.1 peptidase M23B [Endozoicomonas montiporae CL-33]
MASIKYFCLKNRKPVVLTALLASTTAMLWPSGDSDLYREIRIPLAATSDTEQPTAGPVGTVQEEQIQRIGYTIEANDTLGSIFAKLQLPQATMYKLLEADLDFLQLDNLKPGQQLLFIREGENQLVTRMQVVIDSINTLEFTRDGDDYIGEMHAHVTNIIERQVDGVINNSLYRSASNAGLSPAEIDRISRLFEDKINFARDLRAGDTFQMLYDDIYVGDTHTGRSTLKAVIFVNRGKRLAAFLHDDGQYYDETGQSLNRAFLRRPVPEKYRISSHFNPRRLHPITKRISPHNGTDFATPTGTRAQAISDGVVTRVGNHPAAGLHITIQHTETYSTRYLHLSKILVKQGQRVEIGDVVAFTGNTGRSTGPHLHFELHANSKPVNYMTYSLPEGRQLNPSQMVAFQQLVNQYLAKLDTGDESQLVAKATGKPEKV